MENVLMFELSQKGPQVHGRRKLQFFKFFTPGQLKYMNSLIWMEKVHMCELSQKGPHVRDGRKLQLFWFFQKDFENEENHHIFTPGQLKYKNSLIWMENVHMCELGQKGPQVRGVQNLQFFRFFEIFSHYENMPIQIYWKFYHQKMKIFR